VETYLHRVLGLYVTRGDADIVVAALDGAGIPAPKIGIIEPDRGEGGPGAATDSDDVLEELLGWGASIGGLVGAVAGSPPDQGDVPNLIRDALANGYVVLVAHADTDEETTLIQRIIGESMGRPAASLSDESGHPAPLAT
jgi:hypothetical protein